MSALPLAHMPLDAPIGVLWGVGAERAAHLARLGLMTLGDLLLHRPRRYEDRRQVRIIRDVREKGPVTVRGRIVARGVKWYRHRTRSVFELILDDGSGRLHCRWWNMPFLEAHFETGRELMIHGRVVDLKPRTIDHPETELVEEGDEAFVHMDRIVPIYPLTEGVSQRWLRSRLWQLVEYVAPRVVEPHPNLSRGGLPRRADALQSLHFPREFAEADLARQRLAFDEFVELQLAIQSRRQRLYARARGLPCGGDNRLIRPFLARLGFPLTSAQTTVLREIRADLSGGRPMRRLVHGDVGSGKTVVAAAAALMTLESGFAVLLMAPTEILARQHWLRFRAWFAPLGIGLELHTGSSKTVEAPTQPGRSSAIPPSLTIGTHALIAQGFVSTNLGLVIIDEQHKFGVVQREELVRKGDYPHLLVMTATPIPRTLALTVYGDLDVSVIDQPPPGRGRVHTRVRTRAQLPEVWAFVREQLAAGRQAYVVFSRIEDTDDGEVKAVTREFGNLQSALAPYAVGLIHGRLSADEKDRVMTDFCEGRLRVLVATLVIEVGLDIPNATVMVIENAEQFGLAQLHQLRGRIGRGSQESYCVLVAAKGTAESRERLRVLEQGTDGFVIAEADLRLRGPGELLGHAQSGLPALRFADLAGDGELLEQARCSVAEWLAGTVPPASS